MRKYIFLITVTVAFISCNAVLGKLYGINKNLSFESKEAAATYLNKKNKLDKEKIYFFKSEEARLNFFKTEDAELADIPYYVLMVNDTVKVDDSSTGDRGCIGVVDKFVMGYSKDTASFVHKDLRWLDLVNYKGEPLKLNDANPTLVFVITTNLGRIINTTANYVTGHIKEQSKPVNYAYIFIDDLPDNKAVITSK